MSGEPWLVAPRVVSQVHRTEGLCPKARPVGCHARRAARCAPAAIRRAGGARGAPSTLQSGLARLFARRPAVPDAPQVLEALLELWVGERNALDAPVRAGLVVATPFLRPALRAALQPELARLLAYASEDDDPWVRVLARAVGDAAGPLSLAAVSADVPSVRVSPRTRRPSRLTRTARRLVTRWLRCGRARRASSRPRRTATPSSAPWR